MNKYSSLKKIYYASFLSMVVIPILLVFFISLSVIRIMMQNSAISAIQSAQKTVSASLTERVKDASLQLSHFVYVNNNEMMELAAMTDTDDVSQRYHYTTKLDQLFRVAMAPKQAVSSCMIYMKDGKQTYLKQELAISRQEARASHWYQRAVSNKNMVSVGSYNTSEIKILDSMKQGEMVLSVALAPDRLLDRSEKIDAVVLIVQTDIDDMIRHSEKNPGLGTMAILDQTGAVVYETGRSEELASCLEELPEGFQGVMRTKKLPFTLVAAEIADTQWKVVSCVRTSQLTGHFNRVAGIMLAVTGTLFLLYYLFSRFFLRSIIVPVHTMVEGLKKVEEGDLDTHIPPSGQFEIRTMIHSFNQTVRQLKSSLMEQEQARQKKLDAEVRALQSQINPHFLVNTLNSIRFIAQVSKFEAIGKMAEALIRILTCSFRSNGSFYTVSEELEVLNSYLFLMKIRYSDGFETEYQIEQDCLSLRMPRLVLQPVVENAIVHGFSRMEEELGHLTVRVYREEDRLYLEVLDNGCGMTEQEIQKVLHPKERDIADNYNIGIENVYSRLKLYFGDDCGLTIESEPGSYTRARIQIPVMKEENL